MDKSLFIHEILIAIKDFEMQNPSGAFLYKKDFTSKFPQREMFEEIISYLQAAGLIIIMPHG